jgi:hypothetical protein
VKREAEEDWGGEPITAYSSRHRFRSAARLAGVFSPWPWNKAASKRLSGRSDVYALSS